MEQYLSLIHETDSAVEYLINYFQNNEDHVIILFYGDHFPKLSEDFYRELHGGKIATLDEQQLEYTIPFFLWTNYDIEEETVNLTSINYLSNYIYKLAGLPLPEYNEFLLETQNVIPALNSNGYYSNYNQCFTEYENATNDEAEVLRLYNQMVYNSLFDKKNRNEVLFPLNSE